MGILIIFIKMNKIDHFCPGQIWTFLAHFGQIWTGPDLAKFGQNGHFDIFVKFSLPFTGRK